MRIADDTWGCLSTLLVAGLGAASGTVLAYGPLLTRFGERWAAIAILPAAVFGAILAILLAICLAVAMNMVLKSFIWFLRKCGR